MNRERRKGIAKVFFDLAKYLLTAVAVAPLVSEDFKVRNIVIALIIAFIILIIAYYVTPKDKKNDGNN